MEDIDPENVEDLETLLVLKETAPTVEKRWLRNNIFHSIGTVDEQVCTIVIDGESCDNVISQALVDRLKVKSMKALLSLICLVVNDR